LLVAPLLSEAPTDLNLQMQLVMMYKTVSQVFQAGRNIDQADDYIECSKKVLDFKTIRTKKYNILMKIN